MTDDKPTGSDAQRIEDFVMLSLKIDEWEYDPQQPVVSQLFMGMGLNSMSLELEADGLLKDATDRLTDARDKIHKAGTGGVANDPGDSEG